MRNARKESSISQQCAQEASEKLGSEAVYGWGNERMSWRSGENTRKPQASRQPWPSGQGFWCNPTPGLEINFEGRCLVIGSFPELLEMGTPEDFKQSGLVCVYPLH